MKLSKSQRAALREKFGGRCAYCGEELGDRWHADHKGVVTTGRVLRPERDTLENMNPACAPCNLDKHSLTLEAWRALMQRSNEVLMRDVSTFRRAVRYGLVEMKAMPIVFYFETLAQGAHKES